MSRVLENDRQKAKENRPGKHDLSGFTTTTTSYDELW
jgi:hypothetical protein